MLVRAARTTARVENFRTRKCRNDPRGRVGSRLARLRAGVASSARAREPRARRARRRARLRRRCPGATSSPRRSDPPPWMGATASDTGARAVRTASFPYLRERTSCVRAVEGGPRSLVATTGHRESGRDELPTRVERKSERREASCEKSEHFEKPLDPQSRAARDGAAVRAGRARDLERAR